MRILKWKTGIFVVAMTAAAFGALAQDAKKDQPQQMPPMGPPEEMKSVAYLVGTWDCTTKMHMSMDPKDTTWMESKGEVTYKYILDGAFLETTYEQMMMGQKFAGAGWEGYDRETKKWQMTWGDNMSARMSLYTGIHTKDSAVYTGQDIMMGQTMLSRISTHHQTAESFDWSGESSSDGGKTWFTWGTAKYTKRK